MKESRLPSCPSASSRACRQTGHWTRRSSAIPPTRGSQRRSAPATTASTTSLTVTRPAAPCSMRFSRSSGKLVQATSRAGPMCWSSFVSRPRRQLAPECGGKAHQDPRLARLGGEVGAPSGADGTAPGGPWAFGVVGCPFASQSSPAISRIALTPSAIAWWMRPTSATRSPVSGSASRRQSGRVWSRRSESRSPTARRSSSSESGSARSASATCQARSTSGASHPGRTAEPEARLLDPLAEPRKGRHSLADLVAEAARRRGRGRRSPGRRSGPCRCVP